MKKLSEYFLIGFIVWLSVAVAEIYGAPLYRITAPASLICQPIIPEIFEKDTLIYKKSYVSVQSGLTVIFGSNIRHPIAGGGIRLFLEYQREFGRNSLWGISYEGLIPYVQPALTHFLSANCYYRIKLYKDRWALISGVGLGLMHDYDYGYEYQYQKHTFSPAFNGSIMVNVRIWREIYFEFCPWVIYSHRLYYAPIDLRHRTQVAAWPLLAFGLKTRI